jgi:hypothetical protein
MSRQDRSTIKGKFLLTSTLGGGVNNLLTFLPASFGNRAAQMSNLFSEYHINYMRLKFFSSATSGTSGGVVLGILDDASNVEGDAPTTPAAILELRCSGVNFSGETIPTEFMYRPKTSAFWMKTFGGSTGSDDRLVSSGNLFGGLFGTGTTSLSLEIDYSITFQGAVDTGSS